MALNLEIEARVLLHQVRDAVDLDHGLGLDGCLAGIEGDGVGHDLTFGGQTVIERYGALRQADIGDTAVDIVTRMVEPEAPGGQGQGDIDHPHTIDIPLESPLVEGDGKVIPRARDEGVVRLVIIRKAGVQAKLLPSLQVGGSVRLHDAPGDAGGAVSSVKEIDVSAFAVAVFNGFAIGKGKPEDAGAAFALILGIAGLAQEHVVLQRKHLGKECARLLHQRNHRPLPVIGKGDDLPARKGTRLGITGQQVPLGRELTQLLLLEGIFKENFVARNKIGFRVSGLNLLFRGLSGRLLLCSFLRARCSGLLCLLLLVLALADVAVQDVVDTLLNLVAEVVLHRVLGAVLQSFQHVLARRRRADERREGKDHDNFFHLFIINYLSSPFSSASRTISADVEAPNLASSFLRYQRMVSAPRLKVPAICGVVCPAATRRSTWCSRSVKVICVSFIMCFVRLTTNFKNSKTLRTPRKGGSAAFHPEVADDWRIFDNFAI